MTLLKKGNVTGTGAAAAAAAAATAAAGTRQTLTPATIAAAVAPGYFLPFYQ